MTAIRNRKRVVVASLLGAFFGVVIGGVVFAALVVLSPLVVVEARGEGKGGAIVEVLWVLLGIPVCAVVGALWPHTVGRLFAGGRSVGRAA